VRRQFPDRKNAAGLLARAGEGGAGVFHSLPWRAALGTHLLTAADAAGKPYGEGDLLRAHRENAHTPAGGRERRRG